jgi:hypothetical protein
MGDSRLYDIVFAEGETISIPYGSHFSVGTSPYYAHQHGLALDIYNSLLPENYKTYSPVTGEVILSKSLRAPRSRFLGGIDKEYLLQIRGKKNPDIMFKILHIKSELEKGDYVKKGDLLGTTIRNGYFAPWSSPHIHLEIRKFGEINRAKGGKNFSLLLDYNKKQRIHKNKTSHNKIQVKIIHKLSQFLLGRFPTNFYLKIGQIFGLKGCLKNQTSKIDKLSENHELIIDGGIPLYKRGIAIFPITTVINHNKDSSSVYFSTWNIGIIKKRFKRFGFIEFRDVNMFLENIKLRGISLFLSDMFPTVKFIPEKRNAFFKVRKKSLEFTIKP